MNDIKQTVDDYLMRLVNSPNYSANDCANDLTDIIEGHIKKIKSAYIADRNRLKDRIDQLEKDCDYLHSEISNKV